MGVGTHGEDDDMARIPLDPPRTLTYRLTEWYSRRRWGAVADPAAAMAHQPQVLRTNARFEMGVDRWSALDPTLKHLAEMAASVAIGCSWCVDFGWWIATSKGTDPAKLRDVPRWRESGVHTDLERRVLEYAEAMTSTPPAVTDEMVDVLRRELGDAALVELTMMVAVENQRSRFNSALGLSSQGFTDRCEVPATPLRPTGSSAA
jgi:AhpD family alkylhydroperoxidase